MTPLTLVHGAGPGAREAAIAAALAPGVATAIIIEGLSDGNSALADLLEASPAGPVPPKVQIVRIAPGCLCCAGNLILRVTLNRILRRPPGHIFISLASAEHVGQLRAWLSREQLLRLQVDITAGPG